MRQQNKYRRVGASGLLSLLMLVCVITLCFSVGKTYAVITQATNVVVNTFYGESESEESGTSAGTEESGTDESETLDADRAETEGSDTDDTGTTKGEQRGTSETDDSGSDSDVRGTERTGDDSHILIWILIAAAALAGIVTIGKKLRKDRNEGTGKEKD